MQSLCTPHSYHEGKAMNGIPSRQLRVSSQSVLRTSCPPFTHTFTSRNRKVALSGAARYRPRADGRLNGSSNNGSNGRRGKRSLDGSNDPDAELEASR